MESSAEAAAAAIAHAQQVVRIEKARARLLAMHPRQLKQLLLQHVKNCTNDACRTCLKMGIRIWLSRNPLHTCVLHFSPPSATTEPRQLAERLLREGKDIHSKITADGSRTKKISLQYMTAADVRGDIGVLRLAWPRLAEPRSPLDLAKSMEANGLAPIHSAAWMVLRVAEPWSCSTHHLFPAETRQQAVSALLVGSALARRLTGEAEAFMDCWRDVVMPHAIPPAHAETTAAAASASSQSVVDGAHDEEVQEGQDDDEESDDSDGSGDDDDDSDDSEAAEEEEEEGE